MKPSSRLNAAAETQNREIRCSGEGREKESLRTAVKKVYWTVKHGAAGLELQGQTKPEDRDT